MNAPQVYTCSPTRTPPPIKIIWESLMSLILKRLKREQEGEGVGGCGVHLSPWIYQEYTFRHRSACRTPAESGQEYLTSRKEYIDPCKTQ